jgi:hypothetical protein
MTPARQASVNNSGTTFIQDVTLDTATATSRALGSVDIATALDALYVNVTGDTMTGLLTITSGAGDEQLRLDGSSATSNPYLTFYQDGTRRSFIQHNDTGDTLILASEYGVISLRPGSSGVESETLQAHGTGATVTGSLTASTSVITPTVTTASGNLSLTSVGGTVAVTGALTGSSTAAFTTSVSTPTVTTASGNLTLTSTGGTVAVTGAFTGSSTGVFTSTLTAASDTDSTHVFGRAKIGSAIASDSATFAHFDYNTSTGFALAQYFGTTYVNAASGQSVRLANAGNSIAAVGASGIDMQAGMYIGSSDYASQQTGWRVDQHGGGDFRYLYADQLHVKAFIADLEQALAGGQIISKSVAVLATDFVAPYAGGTQLLTVEDLPSASNMAVFEANDIVGMRSFSRASGTLSVAYCFGTVASYTDGAGVQTWTFTRSGTTTYNTITQRGTATSNSTSSGTSTTVTKPTGVVSGDVMLAVVTHDGAADTITATGWTIIGTYTSGSDINFAMYYRVAGGAEGANYSFSTVSSHALAASIVAYYNVATPVFDDYSISTNSASTSMTGTTVFGTATANMLVFLGGITNNSASAPPAGMTELIDAGSSGIRVYVAHQTLAASGETGSKVATIAASHASIVGMVALRPTYSAMSTSAGQITPGSTIEADTLVIDFGIGGNGFYEVSAVDGTYGANSPYARVATYATHPFIDGTVRTQMGNLSGLSGATAGEYGFYAGDGTISTTAQYIRASTAGVQLNNVPIVVSSGGTEALRVTPSEGIRIQAGSSVQNQIDVYSSSDKVYAQWTQLDAVYSNTETQFISYGKTGLGMGTLTLKSQSADGVDSAYIAIGSTYINIVGKPLTVFNGATINSGLALSAGDLDMNGNDIADVRSITVAPPVGASAVSITTPTNQTFPGVSLGAANCGSSYGPFLQIGYNNNGSTPSAAWLRMYRSDGSTGDLWVDASGKLRIGVATAVTNATDTGGTVVGSQSSSLDTKQVIEPFTDYSSALKAIIDAPLFDFTYKSGAFNNQRFTGIVTDYAPTFGMDRDAEHPHGKSLNEVTAHGYTFAAIKALHSRIEQLENQVRKLTHA